MKVYVLRERWGRHVRSSKAPDMEAIPVGVLAAGVPLLITFNWGAWSSWTDLQKTMFVNYWGLYALRTLGYSLPAAVSFVQARINLLIARQAAWLLWTVAGMWAILAGVYFVMAYYSPDQISFAVEETFPWRYLLRYQSRVWAADLVAIASNGRPVYKACYEIGDIILGERWNEYRRFGKADHWDTGYTWNQRKDRFLMHQLWSWLDVWVEYIGMTDRLWGQKFMLQKGFEDPYVSELYPNYVTPPSLLCRQWNPNWQIP